ncbi:MAG: energy coupling factor transporter S component ThiW [Candidatus Caldarchaeum sp.]|nr:energy coupling factor transporter S component ThiW [Candidatus Caldarchaeum sp.]
MPSQPVTKKVALASALSALGIVISPLFFEWLGTRAFPGQHFINVLSGVLLGPVWGAAVATIVGSVRIALGTGTIFAYPGGIPGALAVGLVYILLIRLNLTKFKYLAALAEPLGTVFVGGTIALTVVAPYVGPAIGPAATMLRNVAALGYFPALLLLWGGWAVSSVIGAVAGFGFLVAAEKYGVITKAVAVRNRQKL